LCPNRLYCTLLCYGVYDELQLCTGQQYVTWTARHNENFPPLWAPKFIDKNGGFLKEIDKHLNVLVTMRSKFVQLCLTSVSLPCLSWLLKTTYTAVLILSLLLTDSHPPRRVKRNCKPDNCLLKYTKIKSILRMFSCAILFSVAFKPRGPEELHRCLGYRAICNDKV